MRALCLFLALAALSFLTQNSEAQEIITIKHSCSFEGEEKDEDFYTFPSSNEADEIVGKIVNAFSLSKNFVVKSADCKNALATIEGKKRYILYNTSFLEDFKKDAKTKWAAYCVMAHEIGHHLNNHDFEVDDTKKRKIMELQADKFAGGVLFILGASLDEAKAGIDLLQSKGESATHPPAKARAEAIANGWKNSQEHHDKIKKAEPVAPPIEQPKKQTNTKPVEEYEEEINFNEVSDQLIANTLVGYWQCAFYNTYGAYVVNKSAVYANGAVQVDTYMNGYLSSQSVGTWRIENGYFLERNNQTGILNKFKIDFYDVNTVTLTFSETSGAYLIPIGTQFTYGRMY